MNVPIDNCRDMSGLVRTLDHFIGNFIGSLYLTKKPQKYRGIGHRGDANILTEAEREITVSFRIQNRRSLI